MSPESKINQSVFPEGRKGCVGNWGEMSSYLPSMREGVENLTRAYFRGQKLVSEGKMKKARRYFRLLDKLTGFPEFEADNQPLLTAVDLAVRGATNRKGIKPALRCNHNS